MDFYLFIGYNMDVVMNANYFSNFNSMMTSLDMLASIRREHMRELNLNLNLEGEK